MLADELLLSMINKVHKNLGRMAVKKLYFVEKIARFPH
jgi:hypothetical protein